MENNIKISNTILSALDGCMQRNYINFPADLRRTKIMPIRPENKARYPKDWKEIRKSILARANNRCEFCGVPNYSIRENGTKVVLTIAHLDHTPENCNPDNLRALCQKCHLTYDAKHHAQTAKHTKAEKEQTLVLPFDEV